MEMGRIGAAPIHRSQWMFGGIGHLFLELAP